LVQQRLIPFVMRNSNERLCFPPAAFFSCALAVGSLFDLLSARPILAQVLPVAGQTGARDFVEYWAAARLFAQGGNPYAPAELLAVQRTVGWSGAQPLMMWNPPWTLPFVLSFGLPSFVTGQFCWLLFHVCLMLVAAQQLWRFYGNSAPKSRLPLLLAFTFVPTVFVLIIGQITPLVLAGMTAFLYSERKQNWVAMSAALVVLSIKLHLLYLFWIIFPFWLLHKRSWRLLVIVALTSAGAILLPALFNPRIYVDYFASYGALEVLKPMDWPAPTLRNVIRILLELDHPWLQFGPTALAGVWAVYYWYHHKLEWCWHEQLPLLSAVSVASSFFVWTYDQVVLLPAIVEGAVWISRRPAPWYRFWAARLYVAINTCHMLLRFWLAEELWYFWLAPALLANYLVFRWERTR
jgi:glycosyl transferase family 87